MKKPMSYLDKQLEELAVKYYINQNIDKNSPMPMQEMTINKLKNKVKENKTEIINEYLKTHPKVKKQYEEKKKLIGRIKIGLAVGAITLATGIATNYKLSNTIETKPQVQTEEQSIDNTIEENLEEKIFDKVSQLQSDNEILQYTKEIIVDQYNKNNLQDAINVEDLTLETSNLYLYEKVDKLGNVIGYERSLRDKQEGENVINSTQYIYNVKGERVATYIIDEDGKAVDVKDEKIENKKDFSKYVQIVKKSEDLTKMYKYPSNEKDKDKAKEEYAQCASNLIENEKTEENKIVKNEEIR